MLLSTALAALTLSTLSEARPRHSSRQANNTTNTSSSTSLQFLGINESGPEFGETSLPGTYNTDYTWLNLSTIDTFVAQGFNTFRINTLMERMVSTKDMTSALDVAYMGNLTRDVEYITSLGAYAMIVPHNYGRFYSSIITDSSAFSTFWTNVAKVYANNSKVIFDTNNEYHDMSCKLVAELNQAAIDGIRSAGAVSQYITVEGNAYSGAWTWTTQADAVDDLTNAETMGNLTDPSDKIIYEMHQYLDSDGSGTSETCVSSTIGSKRLVAATEWLRANSKVGMIGEFAGAVNNICEEAIADMLNYIAANSDVWNGALWWGAGPWWGDYMFSVEPADGVAFTTYVPMLAGYA
ncbi:Putative glycoside hydrolase, family 5, glycoside hydrolase superfamily [Septoria linicola]|uniref:cellulase n=1 Tax=Septoria linicola TaxID=215465 RepID=A0A9Q9AM90_9PEZI|nr:putative glycoside hydrolase, family 5, glycoside hydrolase superfamily [Septoria linicola]USW47381.1 Putative glycoside hydrolase, family 5, glycoside hydrolase superfamily [Septoria linicola]